MKKFKEHIYTLFKKDIVIPQRTISELKNSFLNELQDLSISRNNLKWGININFDKKHKVYVWVDALLGYLSVLDNHFDRYWNGNEVVQIFGKEISRFHCIYWPVILKMLNLKIPNKLISHGWLLNNQEKISKSKNNFSSLDNLFSKFDPEYVKYYLVSQINLTQDGLFNEKLLINVINSDLANNFGNLISRTITIASKFKLGLKKYNSNQEFQKIINKHFDLYKQYFDTFEIHKAFFEAMELSRYLNKYIEIQKPWTLDLKNPKLNDILHNLLNGIYAIAIMLQPVMSEKIALFFKEIHYSDININLINKFSKFENHKFNKIIPIFQRVN